MDPLELIFSPLYSLLLSPPKLSLQVPSFFQHISKWPLFIIMFFSYFVVLSGIVYDLINEPPSMGSVRDPRTGRQVPQAVMEYRINGQYLIEGFSAGFLCSLGGLGFIILNLTATKSDMSQLNRYIFLGVGTIFIVAAYNILLMFLRMKVPGYLQ